MKKLIQERIEKAISDKVFPGAVLGVIFQTGKRLILPFGHFTYEEGASLMREDSVFDIASITKSIPTSSLALRLICGGKINLEDPVIQYIPELKFLHCETVQVKHLLTQTLSFGFRLSDYKDKTADEILDIIFKTDHSYKPGTKYSYSNATSILLGLVVERVCGDRLEPLAQKFFFEPLGMDRTTFYPERFKKNNIVPTELDPWRQRVIQGEVHDESAYRLSQKQPVGSAGLFSTAADLLRFMEMLLNDGCINRIRFLSREILDLAQENQIPGLDAQAGLGWEIDAAKFMGKFAGQKTFGKTGFTGCSVVINRMIGVGFALLTNYTYPRRRRNHDLMNNIRRDLADIIFDDLASKRGVGISWNGFINS